MKNNLIALLLLAVSAFAFTSCEKDDDDPQAHTHYGTMANFGLGKAQSYVNMDANDLPLEVGVNLNKAAYESIESQADFSANLNVPAEVENLMGFKHVFFNWNQHGHEPMPVYTIPHFDVHFYYQTQAEREAIMPWDTIKGNSYPAGNHMPATYVPGGLVPQMGNHWIDVFSGELNGETFTETFLFGSYDGKVSFLEPMITKDYIDEKLGTFEKEIKQPAVYELTGKYYPTKFGVKKVNGDYRFYLSGFVKR